MSGPGIPKGTYLGGIRTVECLRQRSHVDPETGCWQWRLGVAVDGTPRVFILHPETGLPYKTTGTNAAFVVSRGRLVLTGRKACRTCDTRTCVNPEHVKAWTRDEHGRAIAKAGLLRGQPARQLGNTIRARRRGKITIEKAREIRRFQGATREAAAIFGISQSRIAKIRSGDAWKEITPANSVFAWAAQA